MTALYSVIWQTAVRLTTSWIGSILLLALHRVSVRVVEVILLNQVILRIYTIQER